MTEQYRGWGLQSTIRRDIDDNTHTAKEANVNRSLGESQEPVVYSGFTAINRRQLDDPNSRVDVGHVNNADTDATNSHAAKHPVVAQYLGLGLDHADYSALERNATMPSAASKKSSHNPDLSGSSSGKQLSKKRSATAPQQKPVKKAKRPQSDAAHVIKSAPKTKPDGKTKAKAKSTPLAHAESQEELIGAPILDHDIETSSSDAYLLSQQTDQNLKAWKYQKSHLPSSTSSCQQYESPVTLDNGLVQQVDCSSTSEPISILSPVTSFDVIRASPGQGPTAHESLFPAPPTNHISCNVEARPRNAALHPHQPPSTGHILETILEESPLSSSDMSRESHRLLPQSSVVPVAVSSTLPSSSLTNNLCRDLIKDDFFDLDDEDIFDLDTSSNYISPALPLTARFQDFQPVHSDSASHAHSTTVENPMQIENDDDWTVLDTEDETALIDLTDDVIDAMTRRLPKLSTSRNAPSPVSNISIIAAARSQLGLSPGKSSPPSQSIGISANLTPAEETEDYLASIHHPPIVRPPFPASISDRSPLLGVSAALLLRTCFRIGEALNTGCTVARSSDTQPSNSILIELYAKVVSSHRDPNGVTQHFTLADLFHERRGPFVKAVCETWKGCELWEYDCGRFLGGASEGEKKVCRAVGRMKRETGEWRFVVLSIWEATWDDVEYARGIICG